MMFLKSDCRDCFVTLIANDVFWIMIAVTVV